MSILFLKQLLQVPVAPARRVRKLGGALFDQKLPLGPRVVLLRENSLQLPEQLVLLPGHALPTLLQPVHRIALQTGHDSLQAAEILQHPQLLGDVDPRLEDPRALLGPGRRVHQYRGYNPKGNRVELIHGRQHGGRVVAPRPIPSRPDSAQALVGHELLEHLGVHSGQLLGEVSVRYLGEIVARPVIHDRIRGATR